jgi:hypothetical protein
MRIKEDYGGDSSRAQRDFLSWSGINKIKIDNNTARI